MLTKYDYFIIKTSDYFPPFGVWVSVGENGFILKIAYYIHTTQHTAFFSFKAPYLLRDRDSFGA